MWGILNPVDQACLEDYGMWEGSIRPWDKSVLLYSLDVIEVLWSIVRMQCVYSIISWQQQNIHIQGSGLESDPYMYKLDVFSKYYGSPTKMVIGSKSRS